MNYLIEASVIVGLIGGVFALIVGVIAVLYDWIRSK